MKKVLGILGSPCSTGKTAELLDAVLEGARSAGAEVERIDLAKMDIRPCQECGRCNSDAACFQTDDDMSTIYEKIRQVDAIVVASPVFFMGVTAQTKAMIDRCQCFWVERFVKKIRAYEGRQRPKGIFVSVAGGPKHTMFEPSRHIVRSFFAAIDFEYAGEVLLGHTDAADVEERKRAVLRRARDVGRKLASQ